MFTAKTPRGDIAMKNILVKFPGKSGKAIAITGHFDTKYFPDLQIRRSRRRRVFHGLADRAGEDPHRPAAHRRCVSGFPSMAKRRSENGGDTDNLYGSRHLARRWRADGTLKRIKALINVDMIGDKNLDIPQEMNSDASLFYSRLVWKTAADLKYQAFFVNQAINEDDDHMPFVKLGVPPLDVIDVDYGTPWHTDDDTMDKLSARSLEIVGTVMFEVIHKAGLRGCGAEKETGHKNRWPVPHAAAILFALARTALCVYRAATQSFTVDESTTFLEYVRGPWERIYQNYDPNNHVLYSILAITLHPRFYEYLNLRCAFPVCWRVSSWCLESTGCSRPPCPRAWSAGSRW